MTIVTACIVVGLYGVVQSLYGVGILVFGTPTLLLLGYDFADALIYLLPSSVAISLSQIIGKSWKSAKISLNLFVVCVPAICLGLYVVLNDFIQLQMEMIIGTILIFFAIIRNVSSVQIFFETILKSNLTLYHFVMGFLHGFSNMGGALLSIMSSSLWQEKQQIRYVTAFYYLIFGLIQILVLIVSGYIEEFYINIYIVPVAIASFWFCGQFIFVRISNPAYQGMITILIAAYGLALWGKALFIQ